MHSSRCQNAGCIITITPLPTQGWCETFQLCQRSDKGCLDYLGSESNFTSEIPTHLSWVPTAGGEHHTETADETHDCSSQPTRSLKIVEDRKCEKPTQLCEGKTCN